MTKIKKQQQKTVREFFDHKVLSFIVVVLLLIVIDLSASLWRTEQQTRQDLRAAINGTSTYGNVSGSTTTK